jgi:hypothetical protein
MNFHHRSAVDYSGGQYGQARRSVKAVVAQRYPGRG